MINNKKKLLNQRKFDIIYESIMNDLGLIKKNIKGNNKNLDLILEEIERPQYITCRSGRKILLEDAINLSQKQLIKEDILDIVKQKIQQLIEWIREGFEYVLHQSAQTIKAFCQRVKNNKIVRKIIYQYNLERSERIIREWYEDDPLVIFTDCNGNICFSEKEFQQRKQEEKMRLNPENKFDIKDKLAESEAKKPLYSVDLKDPQLPDQYVDVAAKMNKMISLFSEAIKDNKNNYALKIDVQRMKKDVDEIIKDSTKQVDHQKIKKTLIRYIVIILILLQILMFIQIILVPLLLCIYLPVITLIIAGDKFQIPKEQIKRSWNKTTEWGKAVGNIFTNVLSSRK